MTDLMFHLRCLAAAGDDAPRRILKGLDLLKTTIDMKPFGDGVETELIQERPDPDVIAQVEALGWESRGLNIGIASGACYFVFKRLKIRDLTPT